MPGVQAPAARPGRAPQSLAEMVHQTRHVRPPRIVLHGRPKIGKSTFGSLMPTPVFIPCEDGLAGINAVSLPLAQGYFDVIGYIGMLAQQEHQFQTVVVDTADWCEKLIHAHICGAENVQSIELAQGGYGKGYIMANNLWRNLLNGLDWLNQHRNMIVLLICHSRVVTINDPMTDPYDSYQLKLHSPKSGNGSAELITEWSDMLVFADTEKFTRQVQIKAGDQGKQGRARASGRRILYTQPNPAYAAGSRYPLPPELEFSWNAVAAALANPQAAGAQ